MPPPPSPIVGGGIETLRAMHCFSATTLLPCFITNQQARQRSTANIHIHAYESYGIMWKREFEITLINTNDDAAMH